MLYAKVDLKTKEVLEFPVYPRILRRRLNDLNVSLPDDITKVDLRLYGYYNVLPTSMQPAAPPGFRAILGMPKWDGDILRRTWAIVAIDPDFETRQWALIRRRRNKLLKESDWTELPSVRETRSKEWAEAWDIYRQQLRDITKIEYSTLAILPEKPNEVE